MTGRPGSHPLCACGNKSIARNMCMSCYDEWRSKNELRRVKKLKTSADHYTANKESITRRHVKRHLERMQIDINYRLLVRLRTRVSRALKNVTKKSPTRIGSVSKDLGCFIQHLKLHLELFWDEGMNWGNYGEWHIDHIRSLDSFDLTDRAQFLEACHFTNLQPLWGKDNEKKGAK